MAPQTPKGLTELLAALAPAQGRLSLEFCSDNGQCGATSLHVDEIAKIRITSSVSGQLILVDEDAAHSLTPLIPNTFAAASAQGWVKAGQPILFPEPEYKFQIQGQAPTGKSRLIAIVAPPGADLSAYAGSTAIKSKGSRSSFGPTPGSDSADAYAAQLGNQIVSLAMPGGSTNTSLPGWGVAVLNYEILAKSP